eukprot:3242730-Rhodomonas_salina.1
MKYACTTYAFPMPPFSPKARVFPLCFCDSRFKKTCQTTQFSAAMYHRRAFERGRSIPSDDTIPS